VVHSQVARRCRGRPWAESRSEPSRCGSRGRTRCPAGRPGSGCASRPPCLLSPAANALGAKVRDCPHGAKASREPGRREAVLARRKQLQIRTLVARRPFGRLRVAPLARGRATPSAVEGREG
jgi:hypothetical protein